jgi:hypothetical protein
MIPTLPLGSSVTQTALMIMIGPELKVLLELYPE